MRCATDNSCALTLHQQFLLHKLFVAYDAFIFWVTYLRGMLYVLLLLYVHVWVLSTTVSCLRFLQPVSSFTRSFDVSIY